VVQNLPQHPLPGAPLDLGQFHNASVTLFGDDLKLSGPEVARLTPG
jgi:hypothetical protein